jgi:hypothetical protein
VPDDQALATHSINRGVPLVLSHRGSAVARAVRGLAQALAGEAAAAPDATTAEAAYRGLLGRLRNRTRPAGA